MKYLVDANVLSEPAKPVPDLRVIEWLRANEPDIAVDPVSPGGLKWAELLARLPTTGKAMPVKDSLIAATAAVHNLAIATRNRADFVMRGESRRPVGDVPFLPAACFNERICWTSNPVSQTLISGD